MSSLPKNKKKEKYIYAYYIWLKEYWRLSKEDKSEFTLWGLVEDIKKMEELRKNNGYKR